MSGQTVINYGYNSFEAMESFYIDPSRDIYLPKICSFQMNNDIDYFDEKPFDLSNCIGVNFDNTPI